VHGLGSVTLGEGFAVRALGWAVGKLKMICWTSSKRLLVCSCRRVVAEESRVLRIAIRATRASIPLSRAERRCELHPASVGLVGVIADR